MSAKKCCVPGCTDSEFKKHRFPKSEPEIFHQWLTNINNEKLFGLDQEKIYQLYRVCDRHFSKDFIVQGTKRGLKRIAVPTLYLPRSQAGMSQRILLPSQVPNEATPQQSTSGILLQQSTDICETVKSTTPEPRASGSSTPRKYTATLEQKSKHSVGSGSRPYKSVLAQVGVTRQADLTPRAKHMYKKLINWSTKVSNMQNRITSYQQRLAYAEKLSDLHNFQEIMEKVNESTYTFILSQIRNQSLHPKARRYTLDEKILALTLFKSSGRAYKLMSKIFALPSKRTLTNLLNKLPLKAGVNESIFVALKESVSKMKPLEKYCSLVFDEMSLSTNVQYNSKEDCIDGVEDYGHDRNPKLADHANVFMIKGIFKSWKQPIVFTFSNGPVKSIKLKNQIKEVILACQNIGLSIICSICDQGATNQAAINSLLKDTAEECTKKGVENRYRGYLVNDQEIVPLYDIPHLFKGIRNNLLTKDLYYVHIGKQRIVKWEHVIQFYYLDIEEENRICHKLTDEHVIPKKIRKMKVKNCTQVFSYKVGSLMDRIAKWGVPGLPKEASDTASFILLMDKLFDSCNSHSKVAPKSKPLKGALKLDSLHEEFWLECIEILKTMKYYDDKKKKYVIVPSLKNLVFTLHSFIYIKKAVLSKFKNSYICLRDLNQDCLENFFSCVRSHGIRNINPSVSLFNKSFKALIVNNFMANHSPHSNCEHDKCEGALSTLRSFLMGDVLPGVAPFSDQDTDITIPDVILMRKTKISRCTINYICGYLVKKLTKLINCKFCLNNITGHNAEDKDMDFISARTYINSKLTVPSKLFSYLVGRSLSHLFYALPRLCHLKSLSEVLDSIIIKKIDLKSLNCNLHSGFSKTISKLTVRCSIYFWCRKINLISSGKDTKFEKFVKNLKDYKLVDPVKLMALKKYKSNQKRYRKSNK